MKKHPIKPHPIKQHPTLGSCGLDCGLCPRYYTAGSSRCPGCCGPGFFDAHPSCSFITHRKTIFNLDFIKKNGIEKFMEQQEKRIGLLGIMLKHFNDGRAKSFYCIAATLLSIGNLERALERAEENTEERVVESTEGRAEESGNIKIRAKNLRQTLNEMASQEGVELKLRKKS